MLLQNGSERRRLGAEPVPAEVMHSVQGGIGSREDYSVRGQRDRNGSKCAFESYALTRKRIDDGCLDLFVTIATEMIGSQRVNRNDHHVGGRRFLSLARRGAYQNYCQQNSGPTAWDES